MSEPRVCAWCNERVKQGEPCVNSPSEQVGRAYRYFHEWCYGLHEHQRAEAAEAKLAELREAAQSVVDRLRAKEPHELDYSHLLNVLERLRVAEGEAMLVAESAEFKLAEMTRERNQDLRNHLENTERMQEKLEDVRTQLHRAMEALREATTALQLAAYTGVPMCAVCGRSSTQHSNVVAALANARAVLAEAGDTPEAK